MFLQSNVLMLRIVKLFLLPAIVFVFAFNVNASTLKSILTPGTVNFKPITFKVTNIDRVKSITWLNQPSEINHLFYEFKTNDGVVYRLEGYPAYKAIADNNLTSVELEILDNSGVATPLVIPVTVLDDTNPAVTFISNTPIQYNKGHHSQIPIQINDLGRNVLSVRALLYVPGDDQSIQAIVGQRSWSKHVGWIEYVDRQTWDWITYEIEETQARTDSDLINYRLPVFIHQNVDTGNYDLRIEVEDNKGNVTLSEPLSVNVLAPVSPPGLVLTAPDYRVPVGEVYTINYNAKHLDRLDRIEFTQSGTTENQIISFTNADYTQNGTVLLKIPDTATEGQTYTVTGTVYDVNGDSSAVSVIVTAGAWGERTVSVSTNQLVDASMQYANVTVLSGATLRHLDDSIKFNSLTVESGAKFIARTKELVVNGILTVNGQLIVNEKKSYQYLRNEKPQGGQHGGDSTGTVNIAYGELRNPNFPGSSTNVNNNFTETGGRLRIIANDIQVNSGGLIKADGLPRYNSGGGVLVFESTSFLVDGSVTANGRSRGAGGSIHITTTDFSGSGTISASAGSNAYAAGGRIAIFYNSFTPTTQPDLGFIFIKSAVAAPEDSPMTSMNIRVLPGSYSGAGTIFLKRADQTFGELYVDNGGNYNSNGNYNYTTLSTLGKHIIENVELVSGTLDQYKVTVQGRPWLLENIYAWHAGTVGKQLSLDSTDKSAPVYEIIEELVAADGINLQYTDTLAKEGLPGSVKQYPITVAQDEEVYIELDDKDFFGKVFVFSDSDNDGVVTTSDLYLGAEFDAPAQQFKPFKKIQLAAGNYIIVVSKQFVSAGEAVLGQSNSNQICNGCEYTLTIKSAKTNSVIIQSATPPVFTAGNEMTGVIRVNHLKVSPGSRLRGAARIQSDTFDITQETAIENIPEIISTSPNNFIDLNIPAQNAFFIGDVTADTVSMGDGTVLTIYGDLTITNDFTISSAAPTGYGYSALTTRLKAKNISVGGSIEITETPLEIDTDNIINATNLSLFSNSSITVPNADAAKQKLFTLNMDVSGKIVIDGSSVIDLTGKGYPVKTGLGFVYDDKHYFVGHGGRGTGDSNNRWNSYGPYGDYNNALYPGVGGYFNKGGGFIRLKANELLLNGLISVDGESYNATGGGINISTNIFNGAGRISAVGGRTANNNNTASGGRVSIIAAIDNFTSVGSTINTGKFENSSGPVATSRYLINLSGAGTSYITSLEGQPGHLIIDNSFNGTPQLTSRTTPLRSVGRHLISNIESLPNNEYRITVTGTPWQEQVLNPDGLGLKGLKIDLNAADYAGELLEIIDGTENTIIVTSTTDITSAVNQELIGVITLDKISVLGGAILETSDRLVLTSPNNSIVDSNSKLITAQISESSLQGLVSVSGMGQLEFTDKVFASTLNISSGNFDFTGGLEVTSLGMSGGKLNVNELNVTDASLNNATIETITLNVSNNLDLIGGAKITVIPQTSRSFYWEDDVHHSLTINVAGIFTIDVNSSVDVNSRGYKYAGPERIGEYSLVNGETYRSNYLWEFAYGCHGGTSIYSHQFFLNWYPDEKYQTCEYGSYRQAQYAGLVSSRYNDTDESGFGGGFVQITAGTLKQHGKILANGITDNPNNRYVGSAGGGIHIVVDNFEGDGAIQARGASDDTRAYDGNYIAGAGGRISAHVALNNTYSGPMDAGPGLNTFAGNLSGSAGTVYVKNPGETYGNLTVDNFSRQTSTTNEVDFPKTNIPSVGRHTIKNVVNLGNNQWRLDTQNNTLFQSYNDSVTATGAGSIKIYNITLTEAQTIQVQMENLSTNYIVALFKDDGSLDNNDDVYSDVWYATDIGSKTFELNLDAGNYFFTVGAYGEDTASGGYWVDEVIAGENKPDNIYYGSYNLTISSTNDTWHNKQEKRLQGNYIAIEDNPTTTNEYKIYYNSESSLFVESTDDLSTAVGKDLIGIHNFQTLKIKGNSHVDFGGDKVNVLDMSQSEFSQDAVIEVGSLDQASIDYISSLPMANLTVTDNINLDHLTINSGNIKFEGTISTINNVEINNVVGASIKGISANNIVIDNSTLQTDFLHSNLDITISNNSTLTTIDKLVWYEPEHTIDINSQGIFTLDVSSKIDLEGKGYQYKYLPEESYYIGNQGRGCHGGRRFNETSQRCVYGKYFSSKLPGSAGYYTTFGGGYVNIKANEVILNGIVNANASPTTSVNNNAGGAGGGVSIEALSMIAGVSSSISANGIVSGGGGRISIKSPNNYLFDGTLEAKGGSINSTDHSGAGTIYVQSPEYPNGYLLVDNQLSNTQLSSTPLSAVGKHKITQASRISPSEIQLHVGIDKSVNIEDTKYLASSGTSAIQRYHFTLDSDRVVRWKISSNDFYPTYWLYKIENGVYSGWYLDGGYDNVISDYGDSLPAGDYMIAVGSTNYIDHDQGADELNGTSSGIPGNYSIEINTISGSTWLVDKEKYGWGLAGFSVDLNANDEVDKGYLISTNNEESLVIQDSILSDAEITALEGNELVGLHTFDRLAVSNGAAVDFGDDRIIINSPQIADFTNFIQLSAGGLNDSAVQVLLNDLNSGLFEIHSDITLASANLTQSNATINGDVLVNNNMTLIGTAKLTINGNLNVTGDLSAGSDSVLSSKAISAAGMLIDGASITTSKLDIGNDLTILESPGNTTLLTTLPASFNPNMVFPLNITVGNEIYIGINAEINVDGKGYPGYFKETNNRSYIYASGPDFDFNTSVGCHAGKISSIQVSCIPYGRLEKAEFAGSSGYHSATTHTDGGGVINISANSIINEGLITARGMSGYYGSAGGSINITANSLTGLGSVYANGGNSTNYYGKSGGGGRISLYLPDIFANGLSMTAGASQVHAKGGQYSSGIQEAGAGTIYVKYTNEEHGHLIVDNEGIAGPNKGTPARQVGRKVLVNIFNVPTTGNAKYELSLKNNTAVHIREKGYVTKDGVGSIIKYPFTLTAARTVDIKIIEGLYAFKLYLLKDNGNNQYSQITSYTSTSTSALASIKNRALQAGNYIVAVISEGRNPSVTDIQNGERRYYWNNKDGNFVLKIDTLGDSWRASGGPYGWGLDGLRMSFTPDITPTAWDDATYPVISNTEESLIIESPSFDPSGLTDMTGVHVFETINVRGNAQVDFGQDILFVKDIPSSVIEAGSVVTSSPNSVRP